MANEATATDQYVRREIEKFGVRYDEQGSSHLEIAKALKGASKQGKSGVGKPEFVLQVSDYLLVIEDKRDNDRLLNLKDGKVAKDIPHYQVMLSMVLFTMLTTLWRKLALLMK